jgi:hypothetical protein
MRVWLIAAVLAATACGDDGGSECGATDPACTTPDPRYEVVLADAPPTLGAFVMEVRAGGTPFTLNLSPVGAIVEAQSMSGGAEWRAVVIGRPSGSSLGNLVFTEEPASTPVVTIVEAAAGAAQGYQILSSTMRVTVQKTQ